MNFKFLLLTFPILIFSGSLFAHCVVDSIGVENQNGKKVILHKLDPKDNFYSVGRRYHVSPQAIIDFNKGAKMDIGEVIKVPTNLPFTDQPVAKTNPAAIYKPAVQPPTTTYQPVQKPVNKPQTQIPVSETTASTTQYKVSAGETLYGISKRFNTTVDDVTTLNGLKSTTVTPGQILLVRSMPPSAESQKPVEKPVQAPVIQQPIVQQPIVAKRDSTAVAYTDSMDSSGRRVPVNRYGLSEKDERGVAVWTDDPDLNSNKQIILHRTAPIGTVIKITNPMTNRTTFARVVGRINDTESTKDAIVVMTKSVADALGALDKRFHVTLSYGTPNE